MAMGSVLTKNKFRIFKILSVILLCFVLSASLYSCKSEPDNIGDTVVNDNTEAIVTGTIENDSQEPTSQQTATAEPIAADTTAETTEEVATTAEEKETKETTERTQPTTTESPPVTTAPPPAIVNIKPEMPVETTEPPVVQVIIPPVEQPVQNQTQATPAIADTGRTAVPKVDVNQYSHNTSYLIGGKCEIGAMIRVTGGTEEIYTGSDHGDYIVEVPFAANGTASLKLTAEMPGKTPSEEIVFEVKPQKNVNYFEKNGSFGVVIGDNYMTYFADCLPDYTGSNLISDAEIAALTVRTEKKINNLRSKGSNSELIYLLVPNTIKIWSNYVPKRYTEHKGDSLLTQWKAGVTAGGATVIDLTDVMMANKTGELKIWHKTDSHWTEYGAYLGYTALMNHIAQKFPDAAPRPSSDFEFYNQEVNFGDIYATLGLNLSDLRETTTFANFKFDPPHYNADYNTGHVNLYDQDCTLKMSARLIHARVSFAHTTKTNLTGLNLPSAYVFRDSFEGSLHAFYTDRFSTATFKSMWNYNFNATEIANLNPDYIIYIVSERTIKNVMYE